MVEKRNSYDHQEWHDLSPQDFMPKSHTSTQPFYEKTILDEIDSLGNYKLNAFAIGIAMT